METKRSSCKIQIMGDCLDYLLENNSNQDGSVGKRSSCKIQIMGDCLDYLLENNSNQDGSVGRRDVEEGLLGSSDDEQWLVGGETPGRRCANLFDDGCTNGGLVGSTDDENWLSGGGTPGKRGLYRIGGKQRVSDGRILQEQTFF